jgi:hypothetical protein
VGKGVAMPTFFLHELKWWARFALPTLQAVTRAVEA